MTMHPAYFDIRFRLDEAPSNWPRALAILTAYQTTGETWPARLGIRLVDDRAVLDPNAELADLRQAIMAQPAPKAPLATACEPAT